MEVAKNDIQTHATAMLNCTKTPFKYKISFGEHLYLVTVFKDIKIKSTGSNSYSNKMNMTN